MRKLLTVLLCLGLAGCATVRQQDLDAWVGMPVEALDTHSLFITVPMVRTVTSSGIEIRNYANGVNVASCAGSGGVNAAGNFLNMNAFTNCSSGWNGCNNLFYIKDGKVIEYVPKGNCYTDKSCQPEERYLRLKSQKSPAVDINANVNSGSK